MTTKKELQEKVAELQAKVDAMEDDARKGNGFLFYPERNAHFYFVDTDIGDGGGYYEAGDWRGVEEDDYNFPKYKDRARAERVAWGRGQLDIWKAMGEDYEKDEEQWFIFGDEEIARPYCQAQKAMWGDALFPTYEAAEQALEEFGGIDKLNEARLAAQWGV